MLCWRVRCRSMSLCLWYQFDVIFELNYGEENCISVQAGLDWRVERKERGNKGQRVRGEIKQGALIGVRLH